MTHDAWRKKVADTAANIAALLDALPDYPGATSTLDDYSAVQAKRAAAVARIIAQIETAHGAKITERWDGAKVRMHGFSASSTMGLVGALQNWIAAAQRKTGGRGA